MTPDTASKGARTSVRTAIPYRRHAILLAASAFLWVPSTSHAETRPNYIVILTDDHGHGDVSAYGSPDARTPHIDSLGRDGIRFTSMRANSTVCSPSRAALLTGRYADRVGVPGVIRTDPQNSWGFFSTGVPTLADLLRTRGYHTALIGKWHLGLESPNTPNERGFDHFHGFLGDMMDSYTTHQRDGKNFMRLNRKTIQPQGHATDLFSDWAADYLRERGRDKKPFFLYLAYNAPHFPIEPPAAALEVVRKRDPGMDPGRAKNVAFVEHLDHGIGRVLAALKEAGLEENTLVVFSADNGGSLPHHQSNHPWRGGKQEHYDGGLRVPFLARWPAFIRNPAVSDHSGLLFDIFPTLLELAGLEIPKDTDAVSLLPVLRGEQPDTSHRDMYFTRREGGDRYKGNCYEALVLGDWKLLRNDPFSPYELYNLKQDPRESHDRAAMDKTVFEHLSRLLNEHIRKGSSTSWKAPGH
jgi:arylsulfatase A-like enzyme